MKAAHQQNTSTITSDKQLPSASSNLAMPSTSPLQTETRPGVVMMEPSAVNIKNGLAADPSSAEVPKQQAAETAPPAADTTTVVETAPPATKAEAAPKEDEQAAAAAPKEGEAAAAPPRHCPRKQRRE